MCSTIKQWGEEYEEIQQMLSEGHIPPSDKAWHATDTLFAQLQNRLRALPEREQQIFQYVFFEALGTKAAFFQVLIDIHQDSCHTLQEAMVLGDQYMNAVLGD